VLRLQKNPDTRFENNPFAKQVYDDFIRVLTGTVVR